MKLKDLFGRSATPNWMQPTTTIIYAADRTALLTRNK